MTGPYRAASRYPGLREVKPLISIHRVQWVKRGIYKLWCLMTEMDYNGLYRHEWIFFSSLGM